MKKLPLVLLLLAARAVTAEPIFVEWTSSGSEPSSEIFGISINSLTCVDLGRLASCEMTVTQVVRMGRVPCQLRIGADHYRVSEGTLKISRRAGTITVEPGVPMAIYSYRYELGLAAWTRSGGGEKFYIIDDAKGVVIKKPFEGQPGKTEVLKVISKSTPGLSAAENVDVELGCSVATVKAVKSNPK